MEKTAFKFLFKYIKMFKWYFLAMLILIILAQIMGQTYPYYIAKIYDTVSGQVGQPDYWDNIIKFALIASGLSLGKMLLSDSVIFVSANFLPTTTSIVVRDVFNYVNKHSVAYFSKEMTGNVATKVNQLSSGTVDFFNYTYGLFYSLSMFTVSIVILSLVNHCYLYVIMIWISAVIYVSILLGRARRSLAKETTKFESSTSGMIVDSLSNYSEVKSFANFKFEKLNLLKSLKEWRKADTKEQMARGYIRFIQQIFNLISILGFLFLSIYMLKIESLTTTEFIYVNTLFMSFSGSVFELSWSYNHISRILGKISSALETLSVEPEINDKPGAVVLKLKKAGIEFKNVSFNYPNRETLFQNLNLIINPGEKIGLVGTSGSGKSTFIKLISRYYDVSSGSILINGVDIRDITQDSLHKNIATIPQDVSLFNRTLFDNIKYGKTTATAEEVYQAAQKAYADIFIKEFENGYQTKVGDRGVILSGGERQRIAIARAILKNAPILVFDEATSALDSESERHIQNSLQNLMQGKTVIAIAHRLSTLREMDRIMVFEKGRIVESGSHSQLISQKGIYRKLYQMQVDGFVGGSD